MTLFQRIVNMLYAFRDYSPVTTSLALMLLPIALLPMHSDQLALSTSEYPKNPLWLKLSFVIMFLLQKMNSFIMYKHIGLSKVSNFQSQDVWLSACKPILLLSSL